MSKLNVSLFEGRPLLDIASYARRGPDGRDRVSPEEVAHISRTVRRVPEAVVKVLSRNSDDFTSVGRHIDYIGRKGEIELETDDGERLSGKGVGRQLLENWDLDLDRHRRQGDLAAALGRNPPKLVHKLMFSMPPGTPAQGVLMAARNFLREEFALAHRYAFVLHTDEPHPHVHAVVKAVSEQGARLNIRKATLRKWRMEFARHLREQGIDANATERAVRGQTIGSQQDGIYRAVLRGDSTFQRERVEQVAAELLNNAWRMDPGRKSLVETRRDIVRGWSDVANKLAEAGERVLANVVREFVTRMPPPRTDRERVAEALQSRTQKSRIGISRTVPDNSPRR
jgi:hypothetical protein